MIHPSPGFSLIAPRAGMFDQWYPLFARYTRFLGTPVDEAGARTVWRWVLDGSYRIAGLLEFDAAKQLAGFALYRPLPDVLLGREICALDALYVDLAFRGQGLERDLLNGVCEIAANRSWCEVRWTAGPADAAEIADKGLLQATNFTTFRVPIDLR
jgi:GNAT superfamily N-acetyltransferase